MNTATDNRPPQSPEPHAPKSEEGRGRFPWRYAVALAAACALGAVLFLPFEVEWKRRNDEPKGTITWDSSRFAFLITYQDDTQELWGPLEVVAAVVLDMPKSLLGILLGLGLGPSVGLAWPPLAGWGEGPRRLRRAGSTLLLAIALGATSVILMIGGAAPLLLSGAGGEEGKAIVLPPWYVALPASFGAAIREEVWLRLGFMTTVVWVLARLTRRTAPGPATLWSGVVLASLLFAALHLSQTVRVVGASGPVIASVLLGGTAVGVVFGWLYWRKGLIAAMAAHATLDVITKVVFPLLGL